MGIQISDPFNPRREILAIPDYNYQNCIPPYQEPQYPAIQVSDPIDPRRLISAMPGCIK